MTCFLQDNRNAESADVDITCVDNDCHSYHNHELQGDPWLRLRPVLSLVASLESCLLDDTADGRHGKKSLDSGEDERQE